MLNKSINFFLFLCIASYIASTSSFFWEFMPDLYDDTKVDNKTSLIPNYISLAALYALASLILIFKNTQPKLIILITMSTLFYCIYHMFITGYYYSFYLFNAILLGYSLNFCKDRVLVIKLIFYALFAYVILMEVFIGESDNLFYIYFSRYHLGFRGPNHLMYYLFFIFIFYVSETKKYDIKLMQKDSFLIILLITILLAFVLTGSKSIILAISCYFLIFYLKVLFKLSAKEILMKTNKYMTTNFLNIIFLILPLLLYFFYRFFYFIFDLPLQLLERYNYMHMAIINWNLFLPNQIILIDNFFFNQISIHGAISILIFMVVTYSISKVSLCISFSLFIYLLLNNSGNSIDIYLALFFFWFFKNYFNKNVRTL